MSEQWETLDGEPVTMLDDDEQQAFRIGAQHRLFHAELRAWRQARGITQHQLSRMAGMQMQRVGALETFRAYPTADERDRLAEVTGIPAARLFPEWLREWATGPKVATTEHEVTQSMLGERTFRALPSPVDDIEETECAVDIELLGDAERRVMEQALSPRQRRILEKRFGLNDNEPQTLAEIGETEGVSRDRIRQIEAEALRKIRHPVGARALRPFLHEIDGRSAHRPKPDPKRCRGLDTGMICPDRFPLPAWFHHVPVEDLHQPMAWCDSCWAGFYRARSRGRTG